MPAARLISQEVSGPLRVLILPASLPIAQEIKRQLSSLPIVEVVENPDSQPVDIFVGISSPFLSSFNVSASKRIIVDPQSFSPPLRDTAAEIISKFIYGYQVQLEEIAPEPEVAPLPSLENYFVPSPPATSNKTAWKWIPYFLLLPLFPWILLIFQIVLLAGFSYCALKTFSISCARPAAKIAEFIEYQMPAALGSKELFNKLGYPPELVVNTLQDLSDVAVSRQQLNNLAGTLFKQFFSTGVDRSLLDSLLFSVNTANESMAYFQSGLKDLYLNSPHPPQFIIPLAEEVSEKRNSLSRLQELSPELPRLLGFGKKLTYLTLLQDHTELRPTGGFLDSYILSTVENGKMLDSYGVTARISDSQLRGTVDPPALFKQITGQSQWYLRDSNWDPDFISTSNRAAWFVSKEYSRDIDVVLALNTSSFSRISAFGNDYLSKYLSQAKPNLPENDSYILASVQNQISNFAHFSTEESSLAASEVLAEFESRQILVSPQTFSSSVLSQLAWNGGLSQQSCTAANCVADYFYPVDTNLGGNKSDAYLSRRQQISINLSPGQAKYSYKLTYRNQPLGSAWLSGVHKNFLRLYLPPSLVFEGLLLDSKPIAQKDIYRYMDHGFLVVAFMSETPVNQVSLVELLASQPLPAASFHYQLSLPRQPGVAGYPLEISYSYPSNWQVTAYKTPSVASAGSLRYNMSLSSPQLINLDFSISQ